MSDAQTANNFRRGVEAAGGRREIEVRVLRDAFGRSRLTDKAREEMESALLLAGVSIEPSLADADLNDRAERDPA